MTTATETTVAELTDKIDRLTAQVEFLTEEALAAKARRREWDELKADVTPLFGEMYSYAARELAEVEPYVSIEQIAHLVKRLMRNMGTIEGMLDQLESFSELVEDAAPLTGDAFVRLMELLDGLERRGYFEFAKSGLGVIDNVVTSFTPEDADALGENVVLIIQAIREMTQPELMLMLRNTASSVRGQEVPENISLFGLIKQMRDPAVKRGLARALSALRTVSGESPEQPEQ
ncbi:MAG: DUF1641 domain-containing protein [Acidimicrobiia bacterium]|jgi:uncharacterized protein YjgD (DUF1641 family)|nr:DUF1641 domain-containing protein [Acidimicrobiia bacterium]